MADVVTTISLSGLAEGAVEEQFQVAFAEVMANIHDPNTLAAKKRLLTIKIEFQPTCDRSYIAYTVSAKVALQPPTAVRAGMFSGSRGGRITVGEHVISQGELDLTLVEEKENV